MAKKRHRICMMVDGAFNELFHVVYGMKDGSVYIVQKLSENYEFADHNEPAKQNRFSVHPSFGEPHITVNQHVYFTNGPEFTTKSNVKPGPMGVFHFVYLRNCCNPRAARYLAPINNEDSYAILDQYDPSNFTLIYGLIAHDPSINLEVEIPHVTPYRAHRIGVTPPDHPFALSIIWGFIAFPAQRTANSVVPRSGHVVQDKALAPGAVLERNIESISSPEDFIWSVASLLCHMQDNWRSRVRELIEAESGQSSVMLDNIEAVSTNILCCGVKE